MPIEKENWIGGLTEWQEGNITYLSVAFSWKLEEAYSRAKFAKMCGRKVIIGGPALFLVKMKHVISDVAEIGKHYSDAIARHNPMATFASRGCPVGCWFCIVPPMEGKKFTFIPDFPVRPILCDNNLSALPDEYQRYIIKRYQDENVPLLDANSGFEPSTFDKSVYIRWKKINRGPWRFAYDELKEKVEVHRVMRMLLDLEPANKKRVYVLIGNEPFSECMQRIQEVIDGGCEPYVQPYMKLNTLKKVPHVLHDWNIQRLLNVARWANRFLWKKIRFAEYDRFYNKKHIEIHDKQQSLI